MHNEIKNSRRKYNRWVANETIEDYSLRYTPQSYRKWSEFLIANTALGSISFLALEAIGASIAIHYGFSTAFWAILTASLIIFITAIPISYHAARYNIDIDLLTRSAGFGYIGSTITSLIYACFCFIFFALEAAILAQALFLLTGLPLVWGYLLSSLIIIPMVFFGITFINKLQLYTQPIWLILMITPFVVVLANEPDALQALTSFSGRISKSSEFSPYYFGFALGISLSLIAQIGEQVDYLRFMPPLTKKNKIRWWLAMLSAGPGWIIIGCLKQLGGIFLASIVLLTGLSIQQAKTPIEMYYVGYQYLFDNPSTVLMVSVLFVVVSQIKINVTNAYAGSLAWSNFFSRITHTHPGRVVWMVFNIAIALLLMELGVFDALEKVLGLYSNVAIAWIGALFADLMINKPLGLSPKIIEFKRAYLYNYNPVGLGSMGIASFISIIAFVGLLGDYAQSYSSLIALFLALLLSPLIAWLTKGKYYIARKNNLITTRNKFSERKCDVCEVSYEITDMAYCPYHNMSICSLCCSLESLCHDVCKKENVQGFRTIAGIKISHLFVNNLSIKGALRLFDFLTISSILFFVVGIIAWMIFSVQSEKIPASSIPFLKEAFVQFYILVSIILSIIVWWILLLQESRQLAEHDLEEQNTALESEIEVRKLAEKKAYKLANYDPLTGLANRNLLHYRMEQLIFQSERTENRFALLFLDLDRFKAVNDSLGHEAGDQLLKQVATRLQSCIRKTDVISRQGGDEFIILLNNVKKTAEIAHVAQNIMTCMSKTITVEEHDIESSFSIGISIYPDDGKDISSLLKSADIAMYKVKEANKNNYLFFNKAMNEDVFNNLMVEQELRLALKDEQLRLYYQPQYCFGEVVGFEALIRWIHPTKGLIYPGDFIHIAEQSDLIIKVGDWVLNESCRQINQWQKQNQPLVPIAINVSQKQFNDSNFLDSVKNCLDKNNMSSGLIELELTEYSMMNNPDLVIQDLLRLKSFGVKLSIDDFGTGYSSLSYLKLFPIDKIKIDLSFIKNLFRSKEDQAIIKTIINLAENLNLKVISEGVENQEQLLFLEEHNAPLVQGFLFYPALPADDAIELLNKKNIGQ